MADQQYDYNQGFNFLEEPQQSETQYDYNKGFSFLEGGNAAAPAQAQPATKPAAAKPIPPAKAPAPYVGMGDVQAAGRVPVSSPVALPQDPVSKAIRGAENALPGSTFEGILRDIVGGASMLTPGAGIADKQSENAYAKPFYGSVLQGATLGLSPDINKGMQQFGAPQNFGQALTRDVGEAAGGFLPLIAGTALGLSPGAAIAGLGAIEHGGKALEGQETPVQAAIGAGEQGIFGSLIGPLADALGPVAGKILPENVGRVAGAVRGAAQMAPAFAGAQAASGLLGTLTGQETWKDYLKSLWQAGAQGAGFGAIGGAPSGGVGGTPEVLREGAKAGEKEAYTYQEPTSADLHKLDKFLNDRIGKVQDEWKARRQAYTDAASKYGSASDEATRARVALDEWHGNLLKATQEYNANRFQQQPVQAPTQEVPTAEEPKVVPTAQSPVTPPAKATGDVLTGVSPGQGINTPEAPVTIPEEAPGEAQVEPEATPEPVTPPTNAADLRKLALSTATPKEFAQTVLGADVDTKDPSYKMMTGMWKTVNDESTKANTVVEPQATEPFTSIDELSAKRLGMPKDLSEDINLLAAEKYENDYLSKPGNEVYAKEANGQKIPGVTVDVSQFPETGGRVPVEVDLGDGNKGVRFYSKYDVTPAKVPMDLREHFPDTDAVAPPTSPEAPGTAQASAQAETPAAEQEAAEAEYQSDEPNAAAQKLYTVALYDAAKKLLAPARYEALAKKQKNVQGVTTPEKIAVKDVGDAVVMAHEVAHAMDLRMNNDKFPPHIMQRFPDFAHGEKNNMAAESKMRKELQAVSQQNRGTSVFNEHQNKAAELMSNYIDFYTKHPQEARALAPTVTKAFEEKLKNFPDIQTIMDDLRDAKAETPSTVERNVAKGLGPAQDMETLRPRDFDSGDMLKSAQNTIVFADRVYRAKVEPIHVLADNLRKLVPDEEMQENLGAAMEHIGNLTTGMSADDVRALIDQSPKAQKALKEVQYQFEKIRQDINKYAKDMTEDELIAFLENYLPHYYISPKKNINAFIGKWARTSPNMKKRTLPTLQEAVDAGLTPLTQNALKLLSRYAETNWRMAVNKRLIFDLRDIKDPETGASVIQKKRVEGYKYLDHPAVRQLYSQRLPDGTMKLWEHGAYVQPDVYDALQSIMENPIEGSLGKWMKVIQNINAIGKEFIVTLSGFHHLFLMAAAHGELARPGNPFRGVFLIGGQEETLGGWVARPHIAGKKLLDSPEFVEDASMAGLTMGSDKQASLMERMLETFEARTRRVPALGKVARSMRQFKESWNRQLWNNLMNPLKAISYYQVVREQLKKLPDDQFTPDNVRKIKEAVASHLNDAFLGQEWIKKFWLTLNGRRILHMLIFAQDYLISNLSLLAKTVGIHPEARGKDIGAKMSRGLSRRFYLNMILGMLAVVEAASYALNGKSSFENEVGHKLQINITPITTALYGDADKTQHYINLSKIFRLDFLNLLSDPINYAGSHIAMVPKIVLEQIFNAEPGSGYQMPWEQKGETFWNSVPERVGSAVSQFSPIGFSSSSFAFSLPITKGMTHGKAYTSYETLIRGLVDPSFAQKFGRLLNGDEYTSMKQQVDDACTANGFDGTTIFKTTKSTLLGEYYGDMWNAIKSNNDGKATEYATILLGLGASDTSVESSGKDRQISDDQVSHAVSLVDALPDDVALRQQDIADELSGVSQ